MDNNSFTSYYFYSDIWDAPEILDMEYNVVDGLCVSQDMYSWIVIKGKVYMSYETSHYGAIEVALMDIHHLDSVEAIEKKFGESIDDICEDVRYGDANEAEGRFWCKYNIIESTGGNLTEDYIRQICEQVGINENEINILGRHIPGTNIDCYPILKYSKNILETILKKKMKQLYLEENGVKFKPTVQWMSENYAKANEELFGGKLGDCIFKAEPIKHNSDWLGSFGISANSTSRKLLANRRTRRIFIENRYNRELETRINSENFFELCHPTITLSTYYSGTQESLYATLVHEMCHYYTYMNGYCPKQAHGREFREIGAIVSYRSNGALTVQRIASAEQMEGYNVDDEIRKKQERRKANARARADYYVIDNPKDSFLMLVNTHSVDVLTKMAKWSREKGSTIYHVVNPEIVEDLYKYGYQSAMRKFVYWPLKKNEQFARDILFDESNYEIYFKP